MYLVVLISFIEHIRSLRFLTEIRLWYELLKTIKAIDLISLSRHIRSRSFLRAVSSKIQDVVRMLLASYLYFYFL